MLARGAMAGLGCGMAVVLLLGALRLWVERRYGEHIYTCVEDVPPHPVALVLGAGLQSDGSLTAILADRVATGADLYHAGVVRKLLCSGDGRLADHDEPQRMLVYAAQLGVPEGDVLLDRGGWRTYDSCYRARAVFGVERAVVVTQRFHAARALYLCNALGVEAVALVADRRRYSIERVTWQAREYLALALAWWDAHVRLQVDLTRAC
jgi:SanA protein